MDELLDKVWSIIDQGIHLLLDRSVSADAARSARHPHADLGRLGDGARACGQSLMAAYHAVLPRRAFVEPTSVGSILIDMPLLLDEGHSCPRSWLEATYQAAWRGVPNDGRRCWAARRRGGLSDSSDPK